MKIDELINLNGTPYISLFDAQRLVADAAKLGVSEAIKECGVAQQSSPWKTTKEAAAYLHCSEVTIRRMAKAGTLKFSQWGAVVRYHADDLDEALAA